MANGGMNTYVPIYIQPASRVALTRPVLIPSSNSSGFYILMSEAKWLDKKHVVFGEVADKESMRTVMAIGAIGNNGGRLSADMQPKIELCGEF